MIVNHYFKMYEELRGSQYCNPHYDSLYFFILTKCADRNIAIRIAIHLGIAILQSAIHQRIASLQSSHNSDFILNMRIATGGLQYCAPHYHCDVIVYIYKCKHQYHPIGTKPKKIISVFGKSIKINLRIYPFDLNSSK